MVKIKAHINNTLHSSGTGMLRREGETGWLSQYRYSCEARKCALQAFHNARLCSSEAARRSAEPGLQRGDQDPALQHPAPLLQQSRIHRCYIAAQSAPQRLEASRSGAVTVPCPEFFWKKGLIACGHKYRQTDTGTHRGRHGTCVLPTCSRLGTLGSSRTPASMCLRCEPATTA